MNKLLIVVLFVVGFISNASANEVYLAANPSAWRLQNYIPDGVVVWGTGSTCGNGQLLMAGNSGIEDHKRFYATVMAAKLANRSMYIYYDNATSPGACFINSFGFD